MHIIVLWQVYLNKAFSIGRNVGLLQDYVSVLTSHSKILIVKEKRQKLIPNKHSKRHNILSSLLLVLLQSVNVGKYLEHYTTYRVLSWEIKKQKIVMRTCILK